MMPINVLLLTTAVILSLTTAFSHIETDRRGEDNRLAASVFRMLPKILSNARDVESELYAAKPGTLSTLMSASNELKRDFLRETMTALRKLLEFFRLHAKEVNLDGAIGTKIAEGQLTVLYDNMKASPERYYATGGSIRKLKQEVDDLATLAKQVCDAAIVHLKLNDPEYFEKTGRTLDDGFWEFDYASKETNADYVYPVVFSGEALNETVSDDCMTELMGTGKSPKRCTVTDYCWDLMTKPQYSQYSLTHQIMYLQVGETMECRKAMNAFVLKYEQGSIGQLYDILCANVNREMKELAAASFPENKHDLFMEQAAICGIIGYQDLYKIRWLKKILSWQQPEGCYGGNTDSGEEKETEERKKPSRVRRAERKMKNGCLSHKTGVAAAALSLYIRYLAEVSALNNNDY